jgi:hypothetical protein
MGQVVIIDVESYAVPKVSDVPEPISLGERQDDPVSLALLFLLVYDLGRCSCGQRVCHGNLLLP